MQHKMQKLIIMCIPHLMFRCKVALSVSTGNGIEVLSASKYVLASRIYCDYKVGYQANPDPRLNPQATERDEVID
jgi:hypothetical protein